MTTTAAALRLLTQQLGSRVAVPGGADHVVVVAESAHDVARVVRAASRAGLRVSAATGDAAPWGEDPGVVVVSTAGLDECVLDPEGWLRVGAGATWQQVADACAPHGLAPPCGWRLGDAVRAFEVVTGDGVLRRAAPDAEPDLFRTLRDGQAPVGVVTAVEVHLVPSAAPGAPALWFDGVDAAAVLHAWHRCSERLPGSATTAVALMRLPARTGIPPVLAGRLTAALRVVPRGAAGAALLADVRAVAPVLLDGAEVAAAAAGEVHGPPVEQVPVPGRRFRLRELTGPALDVLLAAAGPGTGDRPLVVELQARAGAVAGAATAAVVDALAPWRDAVASDRLRAVADRYDPDRVLAGHPIGASCPQMP